MKQKYVVYWHHTILEHRVIKAYSPAEAQYIMEQRFKQNKYNEPVVDGIMSEKEEQEINASRDNPTTW